ncbi:S-adenosyl-L-methionine-dependent methyltransferases superfamily protein [Tanacetum coccineum]
MSDMIALLNDLSYIPPNNEQNEPIQEDIGFMGIENVVRDYRRLLQARSQYDSDGLNGPSMIILLEQYLPDEVAKPIIELCSFFKQICFATLMEDDMLKATINVSILLCNLEPYYPPAFFDIMIHLVIHLPQEALEDAQELKKVIWYVLHNGPEIDTYRSQFKSKFPNKDMKEEFPNWFGSQEKAPVNPIWVEGKRAEFTYPPRIPPEAVGLNKIHHMKMAPRRCLCTTHLGRRSRRERKAAMTRFDLTPHMQSQRWADINAGIQQHL